MIQEIKRWLQIEVMLRRMRIANSREFSVMEKTYNLGHQIMRDKSNNLIWDEADHFSKVIIVTLAKNLHRLQSIRLLCKKGLAKDALPLIRSMFEELVDLKYMAADKSRVQNYIDYDTHTRYKLGKILEQYGGEGVDWPRLKKRNPELEREWKKIEHRYTYKSKDGKNRPFPRWTRDSVRQLSESVGLGSMYGYLYGHISNYAHSNPMSADEFVQGKEGDNVVVEVGASEAFVPQVLATSSGMYLDMLRVANEERKMNLDKIIEPVEIALRKAGEARKIERQDSKP